MKHSPPNTSISKVAKIYNTAFPNSPLSSQFKKITVAYFVLEMDINDVLSIMTKSCNKSKDAERAKRYFCCTCWRKIRSKGYVNVRMDNALLWKMTCEQRDEKDLSPMWRDL
jgi:hypothetical protein